MIASLTLAESILSPVLSTILLIVAAIFIWVLAPANNASLHLSESEIKAIRLGVVIRLSMVVLLGCILLCVCVSVANCIIAAMLAVATMLLLSNFGFGMQ